MKHPNKLPRVAGFASMRVIAPLTLLLVAIILPLTFNSCKKTDQKLPEVKTQETAAQKLLAVMRNYRKQPRNTLVQTGSKARSAHARTADADDVTYYIHFPTIPTAAQVNMYNNASTIQDIVDLRIQSRASVDYTQSPANAGYPVTFSMQGVKNSLQPLITASKDYLKSKGFTDQDIQDMITAKEGAEEDLIPFTTTLAQIEESPRPYMTYPEGYTFYNEHGYKVGHWTKMVNRFSGDTTWYIMGVVDEEYTDPYKAYTLADVGDCAMKAIGADILWALGTSSATTWTVATLRTAFGTAARKFLGPIGVAIAVGEFAWCLYSID
ncbi:hypothetical protein CLV59_10624 [Chitinophaga dinghuensis]|uniref:Uncharacterized protein n=1 Tax=Chitinophaga dinghuensis TaxID=1539050 RepID=A0A327VVV1_9BACT|nr:hypothetical protein [Chitinophaga dinghuensis]RAJ78964.1 hypothetical protein CLV59_10624 [Chitinophaga dinghuensis]